MKLGALGIPSYRSFSLEELVAATNNFETSSFMGEGSQGQVCHCFCYVHSAWSLDIISYIYGIPDVIINGKIMRTILD